MANEINTQQGDERIAVKYSEDFDHMCFGTGGHASGDTNTPTPPVKGDTDLEARIEIPTGTRYQKAATVTFPDDPDKRTVVATATVPKGELNGYTITEAGLYNSNNELLARKTFPGKTLDNDTDYNQIFTFNF